MDPFTKARPGADLLRPPLCSGRREERRRSDPHEPGRGRFGSSAGDAARSPLFALATSCAVAEKQSPGLPTALVRGATSSRHTSRTALSRPAFWQPRSTKTSSRCVPGWPRTVREMRQLLQRNLHPTAKIASQRALRAFQSAVQGTREAEGYDPERRMCHS